MINDKRIYLPKINPQEVLNEIGDFIVSQVLSLGKTGGVIGLSGGVDSTLTAAITKHAFDKYNATLPKQKLELVAYMLPSSTNNEQDMHDAIRVVLKLKIRYGIHDISELVDAFKSTNKEAMENQFHKGNLTSEIRAVVLHGKAATENKLVIGTGNSDEDFGIGYYTLFGDGAVHISPIAGLSKRLVKIMASYVGLGDLAYREPTAGLELGQTDFGDLGYRYEIIEMVQEALKQDFSYEEIIESNSLLSFAKEQIKEYNLKFQNPKFDSPQNLLEDILRRHEIALKKASLLSPAQPKITLINDKIR